MNSKQKPEEFNSYPSEAWEEFVLTPRNGVELARDHVPSLLEPATQSDLSGYWLYLLLTSPVAILFLTLLDSSIISTAIPRITHEFHSTLDIGWYGAAYQLANACMQPLVGKLYTYYPTKTLFLSFFTIFEIGSLVCGLALTSEALILGRLIAGIGAAGVVNGLLAIIAGTVPMAKRPTVVGLGLGIGQIGMMLGPLLGGILTERTTWRWCFFINLPAGAVFASPLLFAKVPEQFDKPADQPIMDFILHKVDLPGLASFIPAAVMFLLFLHYGGNQFPWFSPTVVGLLFGSLCAFTVFLWAEVRKGADAILPLRMIRQQIVWCSCLVMAFSVATTFCTTYFLPIYFQAVMGASPIMSGIYLLPNILSQLAGAVASGVLGNVAAGALLIIGCGLISSYSPTSSQTSWIWYQTILGLGRGVGMQIPIIALQNTLPEKDISIGTSFMMFGHTMGGAISLSFAQTIFTNSLRELVPLYAPSVDPNGVISAGATRDGLVLVDSGGDVAGVLRAVCESVDRVFFMTTGAAFAAFCFAWGIGWKDVREGKGDGGLRKEGADG
ncbi:major facilitator superfamily domain-containing protein [Lasiosphaeris hirsuta]|uniref:Major facilitator superfamily domain-containing protein n=1 Tax=Lasiosphaeris hirsuta TaxID=260670 RepID=A0AA40AS71_9PEZI|nr:major facilitator superfamily domain-containing protein [Lasiosphaeris hirsuta]